MTTNSETIVPEIWFKTQRVVRTIVQFLIVAVPIANGVAVAAINYLETQQDVQVPAWIYVALNAVIAVSALAIGLVARVMAVPGVNEWLTKFGLGSVPKEAVVPAGKFQTRAEYQAYLDSLNGK